MDRHELLERIRAARERTGRTGLRQDGFEGFENELAAEQGLTLARLGRRLDEALARLGELFERASAAEGERRAALVAEHDRVRQELLDARWEMIVVREAMGLRGVRRDVDGTWPVPPPLAR